MHDARFSLFPYYIIVSCEDRFWNDETGSKRAIVIPGQYDVIDDFSSIYNTTAFCERSVTRIACCISSKAFCPRAVYYKARALSRKNYTNLGGANHYLALIYLIDSSIIEFRWVCIQECHLIGCEIPLSEAIQMPGSHSSKKHKLEASAQFHVETDLCERRLNLYVI